MITVIIEGGMSPITVRLRYLIDLLLSVNAVAVRYRDRATGNFKFQLTRTQLNILPVS
jgi:hypothetical protein